MLAADKQALEGELAVQLNQLRLKEVQYLHSSFSALATQAAVLVGFGFMGLQEHTARVLSTDEGADLSLTNWHEFTVGQAGSLAADALWALACSGAMAYNLVVLFLSVLTSIAGHSMALRGPEGSMDVAIYHMERQKKRALKCFGRGLIAICFGLAAQAAEFASALRPIEAVGVLFVACWTAKKLHHYGSDIAEAFHLSERSTVRTTFQGGSGERSLIRALSEGGSEEAFAAGAGDALALRRECGCFGPRRLRPANHGVFTPLWRMDKLLAFPYNGAAQGVGGGAPNPKDDSVAAVVLRAELTRRAPSELKRPSSFVAQHHPHPPSSSTAGILGLMAAAHTP